jgi:hypothetical protein
LPSVSAEAQPARASDTTSDMRSTTLYMIQFLWFG